MEATVMTTALKIRNEFLEQRRPMFEVLGPWDHVFILNKRETARTAANSQNSRKQPEQPQYPEHALSGMPGMPCVLRMAYVACLPRMPCAARMARAACAIWAPDVA